MATRYRRDKQKLQIDCIVWPSICSFCLSRRYLVAIVLSDLRFVASVYLVGILWQKLQIEGQTIQWPQDTEEINKSNKSKVRQYNGHKIPTRSTEATNRRSDNTMATRYRLDKQKLQIEGQTIFWPQKYRRDKQKLQIEGQTIQWPQDIDEIKRSYKSKVWQYNVWPSICCFCLSLRYLVAIVLSDLRFVASVYLVGIVWSLYFLTLDL
jgi:hypothetical protein